MIVLTETPKKLAGWAAAAMTAVRRMELGFGMRCFRSSRFR